MNKKSLNKEKKEKLSSQLEMPKKKASFEETKEAMQKDQKTKK
ncbi:hypothetical protein [Aquimarina spongiae]|uniref:Uncharacterized protein n=1 Tax=Aquimarina spongiae TaxID=570521 RepID=A0A1M6GLG0_9FLAO|nr:hypothetical protein [Aquimarina spongiae]SHJ10696.1 hypothetical protein SAMN04488508_105336 [Aquimarina spongiae]